MMRKRKFILGVAVLAVLAAADGVARITKSEALNKFVSGGIAYKDGRYDDAIVQYTGIVDGGRESGAVYYNLGNSHFRNGDLGRAMLNYERAKRLIPRDSDLNFNHRYATSRVEHYGDAADVPFLRRLVDNFTGFYTVDEMAMLIVAALALLGAVILLSLYLNWPKATARWITLMLALAVVLYAWGIAVKVRQERDRAVIVTAVGSTFEPREDSTVHFKLSEGAKVRIVGKEFGWLKIERLDGKVGWVPEDALEGI